MEVRWHCEGEVGWMSESRRYCSFIGELYYELIRNIHISESVEYIRELIRHTTVGN